MPTLTATARFRRGITVDGVAHQQTLILPADVPTNDQMVDVGELRRLEAAELIVGYSFDLQTNEIIPQKVPNPGAHREHLFRAWRLEGSPEDHVAMRPITPETLVLETDDDVSE